MNKREQLAGDDPELLFADGFDDAIIGVATVMGLPEQKVVYSADKCIEILMERDGMDHEEARDYFGFNVEGSYVGDRTPIFVWECDCTLHTEGVKPIKGLDSVTILGQRALTTKARPNNNQTQKHESGLDWCTGR